MLWEEDWIQCGVPRHHTLRKGPKLLVIVQASERHCNHHFHPINMKDWSGTQRGKWWWHTCYQATSLPETPYPFTSLVGVPASSSFLPFPLSQVPISTSSLFSPYYCPYPLGTAALHCTYAPPFLPTKVGDVGCVTSASTFPLFTPLQPLSHHLPTDILASCVCCYSSESNKFLTVVCKPSFSCPSSKHPCIKTKLFGAVSSHCSSLYGFRGSFAARMVSTCSTSSCGFTCTWAWRGVFLEIWAFTILGSSSASCIRVTSSGASGFSELYHQCY